MKKILILGGYGFMGKSLNKIFKDSNYIIYNESRRTDCDLFNINSIKSKLKLISPDVIIFAAAHVGGISYIGQNSADVVHDNTLMYLNLYRSINDINKNILIINPLSNCSYPGIIDIQDENQWWDGKIHKSVESYGNSKKIGFIISECYREQYGIKTINLIIPNAYGPGDYIDASRTHALNGMVIRMIKSQKNNEDKFVVWGTGQPIREWIFIDDVSNIIKNIIDNNIIDLPNPINLGQEYGISINDSAQTIKEILNYNVEIVNDLSKQDGAPIKILGKKLFDKYFSNFKFTDFNNGISNTINYYKGLI